MPSNPPPPPRKRRPRAGDLPALQRRLWHAILHASAVLDAADTPEVILRAVHAVAQSSNVYARLLELNNLTARIEALEVRLAALKETA